MSQSETIVGLGARTDYLAQVPSADPSRLRLTPDEGQLFAAVGRVARIDEVIRKSGMAEPKAIAVLLSLRAKGAVAPARLQKPSEPVRVDAASAEEVDLPEERKKEILDLERGMDKLNAFAIFGLQPGATPEEVKQAYYAASRRYHPDRYYGKNLGSFRARIDKVFKKLTDAYNTLNDPERRAAYLKAHPELASAPAASASTAAASVSSASALDPERVSERRARMARHPYLLKNSRLSELLGRARERLKNDEPGLALTDLHLAAQLEPQNREIQLLQAEARRRHDVQRATEELKKAETAEQAMDFATAANRYRVAATIDVANARAAYKAAQLMQQQGGDAKEIRTLAQRAVDLEPRNADAKVLLGIVLADADMKKLARKQFEEALLLKPEHAEARKQLKKTRWPF